VHLQQAARLAIPSEGNMNIISVVKFHVNTLKANTRKHEHAARIKYIYHILFSYCPVQLLVTEQSKCCGETYTLDSSIHSNKSLSITRHLVGVGVWVGVGGGMNFPLLLLSSSFSSSSFFKVWTAWFFSSRKVTPEIIQPFHTFVMVIGRED
jgi:hypothetical protein